MRQWKQLEMALFNEVPRGPSHSLPQHLQVRVSVGCASCVPIPLPPVAIDLLQLFYAFVILGREPTCSLVDVTS